MLSKFKFFIFGTIFGIAMVGGISFADEAFYKLTKMDCSVIVNDKKVTLDSPILNYEGKSYLPLRSIAEITDSKIDWNGETKTIQLKSAVKIVTEIVTKEIPKVVTKEVIKEVIKEVTKEVPVDKIVYIDKIKEAEFEYKKVVFPTGESIESVFKTGTAEIVSFGKIFSKDGYEFVGEFSNNKKSGMGKTKYTDGTIHYGEYLNNMQNGKGCVFFKNGDIYIGNFTNDMLDGEGILINTELITIKGLWSNNQFVRAYKSAAPVN